MPIKRTQPKIRRLGGIVKKPGVTRKPLSFIKPEKDPALGIKEAATAEESINNEVKAVKTAIGDRLKAGC